MRLYAAVLLADSAVLRPALLLPDTTLYTCCYSIYLLLPDTTLYTARSTSSAAGGALYATVYCTIHYVLHYNNLLCVRILLYMCPHTTIYVSSYYCMCPDILAYVGGGRI